MLPDGRPPSAERSAIAAAQVVGALQLASVSRRSPGARWCRSAPYDNSPLGRAPKLFDRDRILCAGITVSRHCGQEALVDRHQLESLEFASGEHEGREVDGVQGTQNSAVGDVTGHLTDAPSDLPQFAP